MSLAEVALRVVPCRVVDQRLAQKHLNLVVSPPLCRERLQEHDDALVGTLVLGLEVCKREEQKKEGGMRRMGGKEAVGGNLGRAKIICIPHVVGLAFASHIWQFLSSAIRPSADLTSKSGKDCRTYPAENSPTA